MEQPDSTAIVVALWRAAHVLLDQPPFVLEDRIGLELAYHAEILRAAGFSVLHGAPVGDPGDGWLRDRRMNGMWRRWRASVVARARFVEDMLTAGGVEQYVILGAGLDSFALRRPDLEAGLRVFEVDQPDTQAWKRARLDELGLAVPANLYFAPVDFESSESWMDAIVSAGFDRARPTLVSSLGVTQYITRQATSDMMQLAAQLATKTTFVCGFILPADLIDPAEADMRAATEIGAAGRGSPWISLFSSHDSLTLAEEAGFQVVRHVSADDLTQAYFVDRADGLRPSS